MSLLFKEVGEVTAENVVKRLEGFVTSTPDKLYIGFDRKDAQVLLDLIKLTTKSGSVEDEEVRLREKKKADLLRKIALAQKELEEVG